MSVLLSQFNLFEESSSLHNFRDGIEVDAIPNVV